MADESEWLAPSVKSAIDAVPDEFREIFVEVLDRNDPALLESLRGPHVPSREQRQSVMRIFAREFMQNVEADYEPTSKGKLIDNALGAFLIRWPIEPD